MLEVNCSAFFIFTEINMIIERRVDLICYMWNTPTPNQNEKGTFQLFHLLTQDDSRFYIQTFAYGLNFSFSQSLA